VLTLLIEKWDEKHLTLSEADPIALLHGFDGATRIEGKRTFVEILDVSKGLISEHSELQKGTFQRDHPQAGRSL